jgi:hypothetical protein
MGKSIKVMYSNQIDNCDGELIYDGNYQVRIDSNEKLK